jgi:hypothetical protein
MGPGQGYRPIIKVFDAGGEVIFEFEVFDSIDIPDKKPLKIRHGLEIASGDIDGDGSDEIILGLAHIDEYWMYITAIDYLPDDNDTMLREWFLPYYAHWGINVSSGDVNGDGLDEVITGPGPAWYAKGDLRILSNDWELIYATFLFESGYGMNVGSGDIDGDGIDEVIAAPGPGPDYPPTIKVFDLLGEYVKLEFSAFW